MTHARSLQLAPDALVAALSAPSWRGGGDNMAALLAGGGGDNKAAILASGGGGFGLLQGARGCEWLELQAALTRSRAVFMDDMKTPVLTVPLLAASFLRPSSNGAVYLGLTASTGAVWQAVDIVQWNVTF
jgi:hypothetical protein